MSNIKGVIFPISEENYNRIKSGKNVFVKYCTFKKLKPKQEIQFYITPRKKIGIKAIISSIEILNYDEILKKYGDKLILTPQELKDYMSKNMKGQPRKKSARDHSHSLVIKFDRIQDCNIIPKSRIWTMGIYIR
ncbi:MAG: DUF365 domain-containing protein [Promethearchaeota archaeon]